MLLEKGQRGLLVGQTGSGKTQNALFQLRHSQVWPVTIFDTKIEDEFIGLPEDGDTLEITNSIGEYREVMRRARKDRPTFLVVRPGRGELSNPEILNEYCTVAYERGGAGLYYFDEIYSWHTQGRAPDGLLELLTRGRSKGKTVLMATQRPAWLSRFCLTESQKFYIHWLIDERDAKSLASVIPGFDQLDDPPLHHFWHYDMAKHREPPKLFAPVPLYKPDPVRVKRIRQGWI
jgi:hypothetical protein